jgi:hypothetical protein
MAIITTPFEIPETAFVACSNGNADLFIVVLITIFQRNWQKLQTDCMR